MTSGLKKIIFWGVLAIIIIGGLAYYYQWQMGEITKSTDEKQQSTEQVQMPTATASIDAAIDVAIQGLMAESLFLSDEDKDSALLDADEQTINDFGQSYDEKEF